jgi:hypothetical protein
MFFLLGGKVSLNGRTVWEVRKDHGNCYCGKCALTSTNAWFENKSDAEEYVRIMNEKELR